MTTAALVLVPLIMLSGLAIDVGAGYADGARLQRATDSAALAGAPWLPNQAKAFAAAEAALADNGIVDGIDGAEVAMEVLDQTRLKVTVSGDGPTAIAGELADLDYRIERSATAVLRRPLRLGSPAANLGNDPERPDGTDRLWLTIGGPEVSKHQGDRFVNGRCRPSASGWLSDCPGGAGALNPELAEDGHLFVVNNTNVTSNLRIQAFDPAFVSDGFLCSWAGWTPAQYDALVAHYGQTDTLASDRYDISNRGYCPGDLPVDGAAGPTTYIVREPDTTAFDDSDNKAVCAVTFDPINDSLFARLDPANPANMLPSGRQQMPLHEYFHKWVDICEISAPKLGRYVVQVTTSADLSAPLYSRTGSLGSSGAGSLEQHDPALNTAGANMFALRAGSGQSLQQSGVSVFAEARLPVFLNRDGGSGEFYLARLPESYAGEEIEVTFFDAGDTATGTVGLQVITPPDSNLAVVPGCTFTRDGAPPDNIPESQCGISGMTRAQFDGRKVTLLFTIPETYTCNSADPLGCWFSVRTSSTGSPTDVTTWTAGVRGGPLRLID